MTKTRRSNKDVERLFLLFILCLLSLSLALEVPKTTTVLSSQSLGSFSPLIGKDDAANRPVRLLNWMDTPVDFETAWKAQSDLWQAHANRLASLKKDDDHADTAHNSPCDTILLVQHTPVYTLGTGSDASFVKKDESGEHVNIPVVRMNRGGQVTYHGPGQLVIYPVLDLRHYQQDVHWYLRALEQVVLETCNKLKVEGASRDEDATGIWIQQAKVAAVGISCRKWITQHGVAINVLPEVLPNFQGIVPCGLNRPVACLDDFYNKDDDGTTLTMLQVVEAVKESLQEVFQITLVQDEGESIS